MEDNSKLIVQVNHLKVYFKSFKAVNDISFHIHEGETYGIVGESGSGKSTTVRSILKLVETTDGEIYYKNKEISKMDNKSFQGLRKEIQMIFQDPLASLDPKKSIGDSIVEVLKIHKLYSPKERSYIAFEMLKKVGLSTEHYYKFPHQISGGQAQRVSIARALAINPSLLICDEPVSALDVSIQAQIINLLLELKEKYKLTLIFIAHDLGVVRHISDRIGTMYLGNLVEEAPTDELFSNPLHPYTQLLLSSIPIPEPGCKRDKIILKEEGQPVPDMDSGCIYRFKCHKYTEVCNYVNPELQKVSEGHFVACHLYA
ncbi:MAG: oligopeptide/dipeptide ABC transporter ATP-binding protein [Bacillus sp. (in: firmicutes)]